MNNFSFSSRAMTRPIILPNGQHISVLDMMETLRSQLPIETLKHNFTSYRNCCRGRDIVRALSDIFLIGSTEDAIKYAQYLQIHKILRHVVDNDNEIGMNDNFFRLQCFHNPSILNSYRIWNEKPSQHRSLSMYYTDLLRNLTEHLDNIELDASDSTGAVDYELVLTHIEFCQLEEAACELQAMNLGMFLEDGERMAFLINAYNFFIRLAFIKLGGPTTVSALQTFLAGVFVQIGNDLLSFQDLEYGILRCNQKPHSSSSVPFTKRDHERLLKFTARRLDSRIHFALHRSDGNPSTSKTWFTSANLREELKAAAEEYCGSDKNVNINLDSNTVTLSKLLEWFGKDLSLSKQELLSRLLEYLSDDKKAAMERVIKSSKPVIKFLPYDCTASSSMTFDPTTLKTSAKSLLQKPVSSSNHRSIASGGGGSGSSSGGSQSQRIASAKIFELVAEDCQSDNSSMVSSLSSISRHCRSGFAL